MRENSGFSVTTSKDGRLSKLLSELFSSAEALNLLRVASLTAPLVEELPDINVPPARFFADLADQLMKTGVSKTPQFWDLLLTARPHRATELIELRNEFYVGPDDSVMQEFNVTAWFAGWVYHHAILGTRGSPTAPWTLERSSYPLLSAEHNCPAGGAILALARPNSSGVGFLRAKRELHVLWRAPEQTMVQDGQLVARVRAAGSSPPFGWGFMEETLGILGHAPPLGYRTWTGGQGIVGRCMHIANATQHIQRRTKTGAFAALEESRSVLTLKVSPVPMGIDGWGSVRSVATGKVVWLRATGARRQGDRIAPCTPVCVVVGENLNFVYTLDRPSYLHSAFVTLGDQVAAGQPMFKCLMDTVTLQSPIVGTFYESGSPGAPPFVKVGSRVDKEDVLCIVEAMKLNNEIRADWPGIVEAILVDNASPVQFCQPLIRIRCE